MIDDPLPSGRPDAAEVEEQVEFTWERHWFVSPTILAPWRDTSFGRVAQRFARRVRHIRRLQTTAARSGRVGWMSGAKREPQG